MDSLDIVSVMEKYANRTQGQDLKDGVKKSAQGVDLGQMLDVQATPEEEQRVLRKIDLT